MDNTDSMQEFVGQNRGSVRSKIPLIILILLFIFVIVCFIILIYITTQMKDSDSNSNTDSTSKPEEQSGDKKKSQTPLIGLTGMRVPTLNETMNITETPYSNDDVQVHYIEAVEKTNGIPISLPVLQTFNVDSIAKQLEVVDGILIQGGLDVDPSFYNEERNISVLGQTNIQTDKYLIEVIKQAHAKKMPILGICRGLQILNVAFGGNLFQDISLGGKNVTYHRQDASELCNPRHPINISPNSLLAKMIPNKQTMYVNSWHHQAIDRLAANFEVDARADDGVIEAFHYKSDDQWIFGVQFHPEQFMRCGNDEFKPIFTEFIAQAKKYRESK